LQLIRGCFRRKIGAFGAFGTWHCITAGNFIRYGVPNVPNGAELVLVHLVRGTVLRQKICQIWRTKCSKWYRIGFGAFGTFGTWHWIAAGNSVGYGVPNAPNGTGLVLVHLVRDTELRREILSDMAYQMFQMVQN
jgi:hypothetical protein